MIDHPVFKSLGLFLFLLTMLGLLASGFISPTIGAARWTGGEVTVVATFPKWLEETAVVAERTPTPTSLIRPLSFATSQMSTSGPQGSPARTAVPVSTPLVASDICTATQGQISVEHFYSDSLWRQMRYRVYLPPCYAEAGRLFPVLYLFHGLNYGDKQWDDLELIPLLDAGIAAGELPPMVLILPNLWGIDREPHGGPGSVEEMLVQDLMPLVEARYCTWRAREGRAVGGLSRGAYWALEVAFRHPDLFASVGAHSPAVFSNNAPPEYNPFYVVDEAPDLESLRLYVDVGEQDWLNKWLPDFLARLDARGLEYTFSSAPGDHDVIYWRSQAAAYLDFYAAAWPVDWRDLPPAKLCEAP